MTDYTELKRLAEAVIETDRVSPCDSKRVMLIDPAAALALIAENERLEGRVASEQDRVMSNIGQYSHIENERDQLKAENEALRKHQPNAEWIWCACGDGHAANSYGAGFMAANNGVCENCDAALSKGEQP